MLTKKQLDQLKAELIQQKGDLEELLNSSEEAADTVVLDQTKVGRLSRMDAMQQQAMAQASHSQHQQHLRQIIQALKAIEEGDYGYCQSCGEDIPLERLEARPESVYCVACKTKLEEG